MKIDLDQIRDLLSVVSSTDITELTIEFGDQRITVKKGSHAIQAFLPEQMALPRANATASPQISFEPRMDSASASAPAERTSEKAAESSNGLVPVTSPMVGTFYRSPSPTAPPFVNVGDVVNVGQTVCIIEAMKLMNDMPTEVGGKIVKVCVENGTTVEYGQQLFLVDPRG
ncbi:MAG TPA: acetyl-CoA carboxylase biotin carboxyl carrier protein [Chroococcales cyanobacterium]